VSYPSLDELLRFAQVKWNPNPVELARECLELDDCKLTNSGAVVAYSGKFTGRIPKDKFIVEDELAKQSVWWGGNNALSPEHAQGIRAKALEYLGTKTVYVVDALAGASPNHQIKVRFILERPYHALFVSQLFIKPPVAQLAGFEPDWVVINACRLKLDPKTDGSRTEAAIVLDLTNQEVVIAGTEYAGEIKKSIFTVMNFLLPRQGVMSMHCSANKSTSGSSSLFFGLSGTGKTTLSADPNRELIGDDEHGWSEQGVFNIEGGCYAKCVHLTHAQEPEIWDAIKDGAILENVVLDAKGVPDFDDQSLTENTRAAYPLDFIPNAVIPSVGPHPKHVIFLTCDALGLLPPVSQLSGSQVLTYFLNGYTAKVAGTEIGITEPVLTFSACFGQPFLPLNPQLYGKLLLEYIHRYGSTVWLINTGWTGGPYGVGRRISIGHTRAMLDAIHEDQLADVAYSTHPIFGLRTPTSCPNVPSGLLDPRSTWQDGTSYDVKAAELQQQFETNAAKFTIKFG
jgi:phosphoenolpyruvate carboxykinase (ATP)